MTDWLNVGDISLLERALLRMKEKISSDLEPLEEEYKVGSIHFQYIFGRVCFYHIKGHIVSNILEQHLLEESPNLGILVSILEASTTPYSFEPHNKPFSCHPSRLERFERLTRQSAAQYLTDPDLSIREAFSEVLMLHEVPEA